MKSQRIFQLSHLTHLTLEEVGAGPTTSEAIAAQPPETEGFYGPDWGYLVNSFGGGKNNDIRALSLLVFVLKVKLSKT